MVGFCSFLFLVFGFCVDLAVKGGDRYFFSVISAQCDVFMYIHLYVSMCFSLERTKVMFKS